MGSNHPVLMLAVTAYCTAKGLEPGDIDLVWAVMRKEQIPNLPSEIAAQLDQIIEDITEGHKPWQKL